MKTEFARSLVRLGAGLALASSAWGYTYIWSGSNMPVKWGPGTVTMRIMADNTTHLSDGTTQTTCIQAAMTDATRGWNHYLNIEQFSPVIAAAGTGSDGNGINEIFFSASAYGQSWDTNTLAVTTTWTSNQDGNRRVEADIIFNTKYTWDSYRGSLQSGKIDLQRVALHELGHVLGLNHPDQATPAQSVSAIMNSVISNLDSLASDDITGAQNLYGAPGVVPANDNFANAIAIDLSNNAATVTGSNVAATKESGEPNNASTTGGHSVWWKWTAPTGGNLALNLQGSLFDTTLGVYTGSSVSNLTAIASNDDVQDGVIQYSALNFNATGGTTYYFEVDGFDADEAAITMALNFSSTSSSTAPVFTTQPASQTVVVGTPVTFSATASGSPTPTYQWQKNNVAISGATGSSYSIASAATTDAGNYTVVATNSAGSATSNTATLTVNQTSQQTNLATYNATDFPAKVTAGRRVTFSVNLTNSGTNAWDSNFFLVLRNSALVQQNPADPAANVAFASLSGLAPGATTTVNLSFSAPTIPGKYVFYFQAEDNGVAWFGATSSPMTLTVTSGGPDFNGDGQNDILWENTATGDRAIWFMNGTVVGTFSYLAGIPTAWQVVGTGDLNGDGTTDILWENTATGDRSAWLMNGTTISSFAYVAYVDPVWHIAAVGDFNGDGQPDLVWENTATGDRTIWLMNGTTVSSFSYLAYVDPVWKIVGAGDFNGDGKTDLIWENTTTGDRSLWLMNGTSLASIVDVGIVGPAWHIAMVADFNGDGQPDLLWENTTTGDRAFWLMNGSVKSSSPYLAYVAPVWHIAP